MELYKKYLEEREGKHLFYNEVCFIKYSYPDSNSIYIEDIYVVPEKRKSHVAKNCADKLCIKAKEQFGCNTVFGSVCLDTIGADNSIKVLHAWGMKISHHQDNMIYFKKEI